ncbi:hypothetical protein CEXT_6601 [Caerostris extrusa]|uniref:Uncharacterized protein n=1 Tax=Caerostris extrusa TaxID=172846 RepID=A0AAV4MEH3_CAEEX|nr:hypothetical protein CEXT_6601 [Caerostris extrusa]
MVLLITYTTPKQEAFQKQLKKVDLQPERPSISVCFEKKTSTTLQPRRLDEFILARTPTFYKVYIVQADGKRGMDNDDPELESLVKTIQIKSQTKGSSYLELKVNLYSLPHSFAR